MTPKDLLKYTRTKSVDQLSDFQQLQAGAPAISKQLLQYLDTVFAPKRMLPGEPSIHEHLLFQHGIDHIKDHLRDLNERQERVAREEFNKRS